MDRLELTYADADGNRIGVKRAFSIDCEYGGGSTNSFLVTLSADDSLPIHGYCWVEGTEWGGVVDSRGADGTGIVPVSTWGGRTWHGILAGSVVRNGWSMSGEANAAIESLIQAKGLSGVFSVAQGPSGITLDYEIEPLMTVYDGLCVALAASGARLGISRSCGSVVLSAAPIDDLARSSGGSLAYSATSDERPINHLVCATSGDPQIIVDLFADDDGDVSATQTLFGVDEVAAVYQASGSTAEEVEADGRVKMAKIQASAKTADVTLPDSVVPHVGDSVSFADTSTGASVVQSVTSVTASVTSGSSPSVSYTLGDVMPTSMSSAGGGGSSAYTAGDGITIEGNVISADVTSEDLASVSQQASAAASDAASAQSAASQAVSAASAAVGSVSAQSPISASRSGSEVAVSHDASGVSAGSYGPASNLAPSWGDTVTIPPRVSVDACGHVTQAQGRTLTMPSSTAASDEDGLMSADDKAKLDGMPAKISSLGLRAFIPANSDLDDYTVPGSYACPGNADAATVANAPKASAFTLDVSASTGNSDAPSNYLRQTFKVYNYSGYVWERVKTSPGGAWQAWYANALLDDLSGYLPKSGNAASASKLATQRTISIAGAVEGSATFDGSADVTIRTQGAGADASFGDVWRVGMLLPATEGFDPNGVSGTWERLASDTGPVWWRRIE